MNHGREKGSRKRPIKSRRPGYTGKRKEKEKNRALKVKQKKEESNPSAFIRELKRRYLTARGR